EARVIVHQSWFPTQYPPHWPNDDIRSRALVLLSRGTRRPRRWLWRGLPKPHPGTKPGAWLSGWLRAAHAFESGAKRRQWQKQCMRRIYQPVRRLRAISVAHGQTMGESAMAVGSAAVQFTPDVQAPAAPA